MSQSLDSSLLAESSLTDSEDSASDCVCALSATCKRKSDCDSAMLLSVKDQKQIFHHILIARSNQPPYAGLAWDDTLLWTQIAEATGLSVISVLDCVSYFGDLYDRDPRLGCLADSLLSTSVLFAFQNKPFEITKGRVDVKDLSVRNTVIAQQPQRPLPIVRFLPEPDPWPESSSEHVVGWASDYSGRTRIIKRCLKKSKEEQSQLEKEQAERLKQAERLEQPERLVQPERLEHLPACTSNEPYNQFANEIRQDKNLQFGYRVALSQLYADDLSQLNLRRDESKSMLGIYGPFSPEYMAMSSQPQETRLQMLMSLLELVDMPSNLALQNLRLTLRKKRNEQFL